MPSKVRIKTPEDLRRYIQKTLRIIDSDGHKTIVDKAGAIATLCNAWSRSWELEKLTSIERRLGELERKQQAEESRELYA
ncbi:MAG: hypothetical protein ACE14P_06260 [Methanotrichaceae archaeon]